MAKRVYALDEIRPDGWFDELSGQSKEFQQLCQIVGDHVVACAMVAGVQITSLTVDPRLPSNATVGYQVGQFGPDQELPLVEFRRRVGATLLADRQRVTSLVETPSSSDLQAFLGPRRLLLAAAFELMALELRMNGEEASILLEIAGTSREVSLDEFYDLIDERIRVETGAHQSVDNGVAIDLDLIDEAKKANQQGDWSSTITLLSPWLGPISMLLRTGEAKGLDAEVHTTLSVGLSLLGMAYSRVGNHDLADEVLRLGVQWAGETEESARLFLVLGETSATRARFGEAIGFLRRALRLGGDPKWGLPILARCLLSREQYLAAMVCAERALDAGATDPSVEEVRNSALGMLGDSWQSFQDHVGS